MKRCTNSKFRFAPNLSVMFGDLGRCQVFKVFSGLTPDSLTEILRSRDPEPGHAHMISFSSFIFNLKLRRSKLVFTIECPSDEILKTLDDSQFKQMGLDLPTRNKESGKIIDLPLRNANRK